LTSSPTDFSTSTPVTPSRLSSTARTAPSTRTPPLPDQRYAIIYADPPWSYGNMQHAGAGKAHTGGAEIHYPVMSALDIAELPVQDICERDALCFMWSSSPHLQFAMEILNAWSFAYVTVGFVWNKERVNPGNYTMSQCELCLIGKRGKIPQPRGARNVRQLVSIERTDHSAKPTAVRDRIEQMFPTQAKIELFARTRAPGWDVWGIDAPTA
jgi:N6-adenosine-specific RNA methylase IME4